MPLSDLLSILFVQAQQLEASAEAIRTHDHDRIRQRKAELNTAIGLAKVRLLTDLVDAADQPESDRADDKVSISASFEALERGRALRMRAMETGRPKIGTRASEQDALKDIEFAIYAIQEAEYSILDAATAWAIPAADSGKPPSGVGGAA